MVCLCLDDLFCHRLMMMMMMMDLSMFVSFEGEEQVCLIEVNVMNNLCRILIVHHLNNLKDLLRYCLIDTNCQCPLLS